MTKRMLFDASHPEETRVVILNGDRLEDFDYEAAAHKTLKGNIYLAKVIRVEPSLQAAFVEYGGNRHGFLPFAEIHPDYYRIPIADREALLAEEAEAQREADAREAEADDDESGEDSPAAETAPSAEQAGETGSETNGTGPFVVVGGAEDEDEVEAEVGDEQDRRRGARLRRQYKIQEVIKRRQIMLVQVVKEERGNKGAALTTYLSLAGRYCVLMPNTTRGGGISRKISQAKDRKRLKKIIDELELPDGMAVILRTAGLERTKTEIKRDFDFLVRVWEEIRDRTLTSRAPDLIYEEANLVKRSIRDLYSRDIEEILIQGEEAYRAAKDFMKSLMPSHAKRVQEYREVSPPLFMKFGVEAQLDALHSPTVRLKSGGYIVINPTEALVAIDVNSGRANRERHIEETAYKTNTEAADEIARQLRLRDLAGLVVIDFIDMEDRRNNASVERRLKEALRADRARVQVGRISPLGLLEMSRQRLRPSLFEMNMKLCPHCEGLGYVRLVESSALAALREIEEKALLRKASELTMTCRADIAVYVLNQKREDLARIERSYGLRVLFRPDETVIEPELQITRGIEAPRPVEADDQVEADVVETEREETAERPARERRERGRRQERGGRGRERDRERKSESDADEEKEEVASASDDAEDTPHEAAEAGDADGDGARRRRRGRRGGRRRRRSGENGTAETTDEAATVAGATPLDDPDEASDDDQPATAEVADRDLTADAVVGSEAVSEAPPAEAATDEPVAETPEPVAADTTEEAVEEKPKRRTRRRRKTKAELAAEAAEAEAAATQVAEDSAEVPDPDLVAPQPAEVADAAPNAAPSEPAPEPAPDISEATVETPARAARDDAEVAIEAAAAGIALADADDQPGNVGEPVTELPPEDDDEGDRPKRRGWWQRLVS